jgi:hypothetical protein
MADTGFIKEEQNDEKSIRDYQEIVEEKNQYIHSLLEKVNPLTANTIFPKFSCEIFLSLKFIYSF